MTTYTYIIVTLDLSNQRRYHIIRAADLPTAQRTARARHSAETGAEYDDIYAGERTINTPRRGYIEYDRLIGEGSVWRD